MSRPLSPVPRATAARGLTALQLGALAGAAGTWSIAGPARPILAVLVVTGAIAAVSRWLSPAPATRSLGVLWTVLATPLVAGELVTSFGDPGPRALLALAFLSAAFAGLCAALLRFAERRSSRASTALLRASLVAAAITGVLLLGEIALRVLHEARPYVVVADRGSPEHLFLRDAHVGLRMTPDFRGHYVHPEFDGQRVEINADGYRGPEWRAERLAVPDRPRLLLLGDSFVFGTGVEFADTFGERLAASAPCAVFNAGVPGHAPPHGARLLPELVDRVAPDVVVMAMFTGNDPLDALDLEEPAGRDRRRREPVEAQLTADRGHVDLLLRRLWSPAYWQRGSRVGGAVLGALARVGPRLPSLDYQDFELRTCAVRPDPEAERALGLCEQGVLTAATFCRERTVRFVLVLVPPIALVDREMFERIFAVRPLPRERFSPDVLHARLRRCAEARGIAVCDLLAPLRERHALGEQLYHREGHWNAAGHRLAAECILTALRDQRWL